YLPAEVVFAVSSIFFDSTPPRGASLWNIATIVHFLDCIGHFPNASFWIVADDDIWVHVENLRAFVEELDPNEISTFGTAAGDALNVWGGVVGYSPGFVKWLVASSKRFRSCSDSTYEYNKRKAARPLKNYYLRFGIPVAPYHQDCYLSYCSIKMASAKVYRSDLFYYDNPVNATLLDYSSALLEPYLGRAISIHHLKANDIDYLLYHAPERVMANVVNAARSYRPVHGGYATPMEPMRGGRLDGLQRDGMMPPRGGPSGAMGSCYNLRGDDVPVPMVGRAELPCKRAREEGKTVEVQSIGESTSKVMRTDTPDDVQFYCVDVDRLYHSKV
ncbi:hypothetical protein FOL46_007650, partial [Perkinsus olseni]